MALHFVVKLRDVVSIENASPADGKIIANMVEEFKIKKNGRFDQDLIGRLQASSLMVDQMHTTICNTEVIEKDHSGSFCKF